jgi:hypothetical protein
MVEASRRVALLAALAGALAASAGAREAKKPAKPTAGSPVAPPIDHAAMGHAAPAGAVADNIVALTPAETAVVAALTRCRMAAEQASSFGIEALAAGDASMKVCTQATREVAVLCETTVSLVYLRSKLARTQMALCRQSCMEAKSECEVHAAHHWTCRAAAEACDAAIDAMNTILG